MKHVPPKVPVHPEAHNVALFRKRVFVHIIQLRIKMRLGTRVSPEGQHPYKRQGEKPTTTTDWVRKRPYEDRGRALEPRVTWSHQELE